MRHVRSSCSKQFRTPSICQNADICSEHCSEKRHNAEFRFGRFDRIEADDSSDEKSCCVDGA